MGEAQRQAWAKPRLTAALVVADALAFLIGGSVLFLLGFLIGTATKDSDAISPNSSSNRLTRPDTLLSSPHRGKEPQKARQQ